MLSSSSSFNALRVIMKSLYLQGTQPIHTSSDQEQINKQTT